MRKSQQSHFKVRQAARLWHAGWGRTVVRPRFSTATTIEQQQMVTADFEEFQRENSVIAVYTFGGMLWDGILDGFPIEKPGGLGRIV